MNSKIFFVVILCLAFLPVVRADIIMPGEGIVSINNHITNINDFSDYVFVISGHIGPQMCPIKLVPDNGEVPSQYKFCGGSVYAIPKDKFGQSKINEINAENSNYSDEMIISYFNSLGAKEVIKDIEHQTQVLELSSQTEINNYYMVDLNKVLDRPNKVDKERNWLIYVYIIVPILALAVIIFIIIKRKKK